MSDLYEIEFYNSDDPELAKENELTTVEQLNIAKHANEALSQLIQDKDSIIENLILRYDLGVIQKENVTSNKRFTSIDEIELEQLRHKAKALAHRTILENMELREMVNELRDTNFHLQNEIYELVCFYIVIFIILIYNIML